MKTTERIDLTTLGSYTTGVMHYADEHPEVRFQNTEVYDAQGRYCLMVSEYDPTDTDRTGEAIGAIVWYDVADGWQREQTIAGVWVCRKGERYIIITN